MKANKESILYCDELEGELHDAEMMQLDEQIFLMPHYPCEFEVKFLDCHYIKNIITHYLLVLSFKTLVWILKSGYKRTELMPCRWSSKSCLFIWARLMWSRGKRGNTYNPSNCKAYDEDKKPINCKFIRFLNQFRISNGTESLGVSPMIDLYLSKIAKEINFFLDFFQKTMAYRGILSFSFWNDKG